MSSNFPPGGSQGPEYLEQGGGAPLPRASEPRRSGGRKPALIASGVIAGLLVVGGGVWAATWYFSTGAQPAQALPDSTLGYMSIDLDPSGAQKIEAVRMLNKFPAIKDQIGLDAQDDIRKRLFEEIQKSGDCADLDYGDDIEPWLGDRAAVAAVDTGEDQPSPVVVVQVKDEDKADAGLAKLRDCGQASEPGTTDGGSDTTGGWAIDGDWVVIAETDAIAKQVADDAAESSLSDDDDFQKWTDEVGDPGVVNLYAAPAAGKYLAKNLADLTGMFGGSGSAASCATNSDGTMADPFCSDTETYESNNPMPSEMVDALEEFQGAAATVRFDDGALELEMAGDPGVSRTGLYGTEGGDDVVATLPADTAAAIGVGFQDGWFTDFVEQVASYDGEQSASQLMDDMAQESGLDLPDDAETLMGDSMALSLGSDFDIETFFNSGDASGFPIAGKLKGDPDAMTGVLDKLRADMSTEDASTLETDSDGAMLAIGPNPGYRSQVLDDGNLGGSNVFQDVVREADKSSALVYVNFDAGDWLTNLAQDDQEAVDNLEPLEGFGISLWQEDDAAHAVVRLTTN
ncbi:hypothetical protein GCM10009844_37430 [Nocardioides koreensis]|uniref:DUF3352 domain-containing protein n=1 Tax=Nocardioides koreensis TaxID=433651 RepID=A0ABP5LSQ7_9ACTN